ncbi:hypothetical protein D3C81_1475640 [compost metagenome]
MTLQAPMACIRRRLDRASSRSSTWAVKGVAAPYRMVPVEKMRGPTTLPALASSLWAKISLESLDGSWMVVTPNASAA